MKNLKSLQIATIILSLLFCLSCSKDDDNNDDGGGGQQGDLSGFTFDGEIYVTDRGEYYDADDSGFLFFMNNDLNKVASTSFVFSKPFQMLNDGTYVYMADKFDPNYDPEKNFWVGSVSFQDGVPNPIVNGQITLNKQGNGTYVITYSVSIAEGNIVGDYSGTIIPR